MSLLATFVGAALLAVILFALAKFAPNFLYRLGGGPDFGSGPAAGGSYGEGNFDGDGD